MSFKRFVSRAAGASSRRALRLIGTERNANITLAPVFHVEKQHIDEYHDSLLRFLVRYREVTGARAVATCITPECPMLANELRSAGYDSEAYWQRISSIKQHAIIGLHGHFLRGDPADGIIPMHLSFYDLAVIKNQIDQETQALEDRNLFDGGPRCYSAGWWFMTPELRAHLRARGYEWDFSVSDSRWNTVAIPPADAASRTEAGERDSLAIGSAVAISSVARAGSHTSALHILLRHSLAGQKKYLTFYGHDFDLPATEAIDAIEEMVACGFRFAEPQGRPLQIAESVRGVA